MVLRRDIEWRAIVDALDHGVVVLDDASRIVALNPAAERLLERDAEAIAGRRADDLGARWSARTAPRWTPGRSRR